MARACGCRRVDGSGADVFLNSVARADASFVVPFSYGTLLFATLYDALIFGVIPTSVSLLGAGIIIAGAALLAWRQAITSKA